MNNDEINALFAEHIPPGTVLVRHSPEQMARVRMDGTHFKAWAASLVGSGYEFHYADTPMEALDKALDGRQLPP